MNPLLTQMLGESASVEIQASMIYSGFLVEEEGTVSTFRALLEGERGVLRLERLPW
jgi:hypothetical protein